MHDLNPGQDSGYLDGGFHSCPQSLQPKSGEVPSSSPNHSNSPVILSAMLHSTQYWQYCNIKGQFQWPSRFCKSQGSSWPSVEYHQQECCSTEFNNKHSFSRLHLNKTLYTETHCGQLQMCVFTTFSTHKSFICNVEYVNNSVWKDY